MRRWLTAFLPFLVAAASLFVGLAPTLLDYGRFAPLDWLVPGFVALAAMQLVRGAGPVRVVLPWALVVLPPMLVVGLAASVMPWPGLVGLALLLALGAAALARTRGRPWLAALLGLVLMVAIRLAAWALEGPLVSTPPMGRVAVMTALPLFHGEHANGDALQGIGMRAPIMRGLEEDWRLDPIDRLDAASLRGAGRLLLAQPRLLDPAELVALDDWVRAGGHAVILADPLLRWPDERPLGHPRRPPMTSLLDPLMTHWGLALDYAPMGFVERRVVTGGAMIQLAGASAFVAARNAPCTLAENGLIAYCRIGKGRAVLVADADWIDDRLWTLWPERPRDARGWASDALPILSQLIAGTEGPFKPSGAWMISQAALVSALRWALGLAALLAAALASFASRPNSAHVRATDFQSPGRKSGEPPPDST
jgi:hypothetical protein